MTPPESSTRAQELFARGLLVQSLTAQWLAGLWLLPLAAAVALSGQLARPHVLPMVSLSAWLLALGLVPALLSLRAGGRSIATTLLIGGAALVGTAGWYTSGAADPFGASVAGVQWILLWLSVALGASLDVRGRKLFARWLPWFGLALGAVLLWAPSQLEGGSPFGNIGRDSQALAPAAAAAAAWTTRRRSSPWLFLAVVLAWAIHAAVQPVLAGGLTLALIGAALLLRPGRPSARASEDSRDDSSSPTVVTLRRFAPLAVGLAALVWPLSQQAAPATPASNGGSQTESIAAGFERDDLGGLEVRARLWGTAPAMLAAHPLGVGLGQFAAQYPPFRDPVERERSSLGGAQPTEVEHLHNDLLIAFVELGALGGLLFALFWLLALRAAWGALGGSASDAALGAAALATLITGGQHAVLLGHPIAALIGGGALGACLARARAERLPEGPAARARFPFQALLLPLGAGVFGLLPALRTQAHGELLTSFAENNRDFERARQQAANPDQAAAPQIAAAQAAMSSLFVEREQIVAGLLQEGPASNLGTALVVGQFFNGLDPREAEAWRSFDARPESPANSGELHWAGFIARLTVSPNDAWPAEQGGTASPWSMAADELERLIARAQYMRPHSAGPWIQAGYLGQLRGARSLSEGSAGEDSPAARASSVNAWANAREAFGQALAREPGHPAARLLLQELELRAGSLERAAVLLENNSDQAFVAARDAYLSGWRGLSDTLALLEVAGNRPSVGEAAKAIADELESQNSGGRSRQFWNALAHHMWAYDHLDEGRLDDARRSLRQASRHASANGEPGSVLIDAELDAARRASGDGGRTDPADLESDLRARLEALAAQPSIDAPTPAELPPGIPPALGARLRQCHGLVTLQAAQVLGGS